MSTDISLVLNHITSNPNNILAFLRSQQDSVLSSLLDNNQDPLTVLQVQSHSLGILFILSARLLGDPTHAPNWNIVLDFCANFNPEHVRLAPERVTLLAKGILGFVGAQNSSHRAIEPLLNLATRFPPSPSHLTTVHPFLLHTCAATRNFAPVLPLLINHPITTVFPFPHSTSPDSALSATDNLIYHYLAGMILAASKRWSEAEDYLDMCVSSPSSAISAIQLEAAKKLVIVQLIGSGKTSPFPKYANAQLQRMVKNTPYAAFAEAYPHKVERMQDIVRAEQGLFAQDQNLGLVRQALGRAPRWSIKKLTGTYLTLSISEIARALDKEGSVIPGGLDGIRDLVVDMIKTDEIAAVVGADGTVTFSDERPAPKVTGAQIDVALREAQYQVGVLKRIEEEMERSREYLTKAVKAKDDGSSWGNHPVMMDMDEYGLGVPGSSSSAWVDSDMFGV